MRLLPTYPKREIDVLGLTFGQKSLTGRGGYTPEDVRDVMEIMCFGRWCIEKLITHEFPLNQLEQALMTTPDTDMACNVIIDFG